MLDIVDSDDTKRKGCKRIPEGRKCIICGSDKTHINKYGNPEWSKYRGKFLEKEWDGKSFICNKCDSDIRNNLPDSYKNAIKPIASSRAGNLSRYIENGKSIITQWIVAKTLGLEDLNIVNDNFAETTDLSPHHMYGRIDVKSASLFGDRWVLSRMNKDCDTFIFLLMDDKEPWRDVKRGYAPPCKVVFGEKSISIFVDWDSGVRLRKWYFWKSTE